MSLADDLARFRRSYSRPRPAAEPAPAATAPVHPSNRHPDGSGPSRKSWGRSGFKGVYPTPRGRYAAAVRHAGKHHHCGTFDTAEEAFLAAEAKRAELGKGLTRDR